jgi:hypothetical protein
MVTEEVTLRRYDPHHDLDYCHDVHFTVAS